MPELERFKAEINLTEYAASEGYEIDRKESSRNSVVMRHPSGDKVIIARGVDRHWIYFSVRNDRDNGTILDFIRSRKGLSLGEIRNEMPRICWDHAPPLPAAFTSRTAFLRRTERHRSRPPAQLLVSHAFALRQFQHYVTLG